MKNRLFFILTVALLAILLTPILATAQATDNATLTLTGTVPSIVRIGFGDVASNGTLALSDLNANAPSGVSGTDSTLVYAGNVAFEVTVTSANGGALQYNDTLSGGAAPSGFATAVGYTMTVGGSNADLTGTNPVVSASAGIYQAVDVVVTADPLGIDNLSGSSNVADVEAAGTYQDILTFTITAP